MFQTHIKFLTYASRLQGILGLRWVILGMFRVLV